MNGWVSSVEVFTWNVSRTVGDINSNSNGGSFTGITVMKKPVSTLCCPSDTLIFNEACPNQLGCGAIVTVSPSMIRSKYGSPVIKPYSKSSLSMSCAEIIIYSF